MEDYSIALTKALHTNDVVTLKEISLNEDYVHPLKVDWVAIKNAITMNSKEALAYIIDNPTFNTYIDQGNVSYCVEKGNKEILDLLLTPQFFKKYSKKDIQSFRQTLLFMAIHHQHIDMIDYFIEDIIKNDPFYNIKQLFSSLGLKTTQENHFINFKKIYKDNFLNLTPIYQTISPILLTAALTNNKDVFEHILHHPKLTKMLSLAEKKNKYLLLFTVENTLPNISQYLIKKHIFDITLTNEKQETILDRKFFNDNEKFLCDLLNNSNYQQKFNFQQYYDKLLINVVDYGDLTLTKEIISKIDNFDINKEYSNEKTLLEISHDAFYCDNVEIIKYLLTFPNIKIKKPEHDNDTVFNYACVREEYDLIKTLLIDKNFPIDKDITEWLQGDNDDGVVYDKVIELIEKLDLHKRINETTTSHNNKNKKINKI